MKKERRRELRHLALQLAAQLPLDPIETEQVLDWLSELASGFLRETDGKED